MLLAEKGCAKCKHAAHSHNPPCLPVTLRHGLQLKQTCNPLFGPYRAVGTSAASSEVAAVLKLLRVMAGAASELPVLRPRCVRRHSLCRGRQCAIKGWKPCLPRGDRV